MGKNPKDGGVSRRDFLKTSGAGAVSATILAGGKAKAAQGGGTGILGPGAVPITLTVDGRQRQVSLEPRVTLLDALRNHLDETGAKRVCDRGTCGACTVLLDKKLVYACSVLAIEAQGREIETVHSLGSPEQLHPVQAAIVEHDGSQCGFCTPGFVMACKDLLDKHPQPSRHDVELGLGGNLCRCGTYSGLKAAVQELAEKGATRHG